MEDIDDAPEQILQIGLDAGIDEAARQCVEDIGDGAASEPVARERPCVGFILIGPMTVKLHFLEQVSAGAGLIRFAALGKVGQVDHVVFLVWGRASRGLRGDTSAAAGAGSHRAAPRAAEAPAKDGGLATILFRDAKGRQPRRKIAASRAIARPAHAAAVALQRRPRRGLPRTG